ncbi:MAG: Lrp/AsnC family transcriptional regulator [Clostridia bacterium]|nr:Lrp/AsnC family transcriptional regulator [Clostridia bacterium]
MVQNDKRILKLLEKNAHFTAEDIAAVLGDKAEKIAARIKELEESGIIRGYKSVIDWERLDEDRASAIIELNVTPSAGHGFEEVAARIAKYPEVESVSLVSGGYDLSVTVKGRTFHEVCNFVARELATIDSVTQTRTQFIMRRYKELDIELTSDERDERDNVSL